MRKVIALEFITLDGVIQAGGGPEEDTSGGFAHGGWQVPYSDEVIGAEMERQLSLPFDLLLGRTTSDIWAAYWPHHAEFWAATSRKWSAVSSSSRGPICTSTEARISCRRSSGMIWSMSCG